MIEVSKVRKSFGDQVVLRSISFSVEAGESVAIIGRSGTGKSVLIKHLVGLLSPDEGAVRVEGQDLVGMSERQMLSVRQKFGMLFQGAALFDSMNVHENIAFPLRRSGVTDGAEINRRVKSVLGLVELPGVGGKMPSELSGGMQKRVGLARAIVHRPQIILYDEPTTGLDPVVADSIDQLMMRVRDQYSVTSIVITHDMRCARRMGQRIIYLREGQVYLDAPAEEVFNSEDPQVSRFIRGEADLKEVDFS
ncbi:MAG TPA: ABC transporter ATP-binding protein [Verrucomicrobiales bacterium]|jgi:phospholipid/cholesterol/gamma-HCH transport system ATP-binding protein|nr:ABC transporter ATP-binding protein [Verrucomicrobiales bacterium]|tara:strand:+ start:1144 stop:1893 length:750 start_codon:yes stop_codon:yes gene_type:complete